MALSAGQRLGPYEVLVLIGEGGMGQVYRARDTKLNREVALKVLPEVVAGDADRLARFQREAQVLASLNHPNIAHIHGFEDSGSTHALVMELVEGPTLAERIAHGPIGPTEALPIARQIADALEAAHEQGIVHRDLKPANIKVRADGTVKVLDFGLAKATDPSAGSSSSVANSPTMTSPAMTAMGIILGTAAYMSPEQAKGKAVDKRADIWAFGVVLYEMLSGRRAFEGEDVSDLLVAVLSKDVDFSTLPAGTPPAIVSLIRRCLARDPKKRLRDIGEARLLLEDPASLEPAVLPLSAKTAQPPASFWRRSWPWAIAGGAVLVAGVLLTIWAPWRSALAPAPAPLRLLAGLGADAYSVRSDLFQGSGVVVSPNGKTLVFMGARKVAGSRPQLFVRNLDQLQATPLEGTEGAFAPFFSPDSQWIAFFVGSQDGWLKKTSVAGGASSKICAVVYGRGGSWAEDDTIVFSHLAKPATTLMRVPAAGGTPVAFGAFGEGATSQRWPQVLPGGTHVLYTEHSSVNRFDYANLVVEPLGGLSAGASAKAGGTPKIIVRGGSYGRYVAIRSIGYLTYVRENTLLAMPFDLARLEATGPAVPVVDDVALGGVGDGGSASYSISPDGTLVYLPNTNTEPVSPIHWLSRDGTTSVLRAAATHWSGMSLSPEGLRLALVERDRQQRLFVHDITRDIALPVTAEGVASSPVWTRDGRRLAVGLDTGTGVSNLWLVNADGSGSPTRLTTGPNDQQPASWDPTGKFLAYTEIRPNTTRDVMILPVEGDDTRGWKAGTPIVFKGTAANETDPAFSPDGRWVAYTSLESGTTEVYVSAYPGPGAPVPVSTGGGFAPRWSATTRELLFWSGGKIMSASYTSTDKFLPGKPQPWAPQDGSVYLGFDLHPDGKRVAVRLADAEARRAAAYSLDKIVFWSGFGDYLRKNVAEKK